jgi:hypothetical protein
VIFSSLRKYYITSPTPPPGPGPYQLAMPKPAPAQPPWYRSRTFIIGAASFPLFFTVLGIAQNLHHFQTPAGSRYELATRPPTLPRNTLLASHAASVKAPIALTTIIPLCLSFVAPALVPRRPDIISTLGSQLSIIVSRTILLYAVPHRLRLSKILDFSDHIVRKQPIIRRGGAQLRRPPSSGCRGETPRAPLLPARLRVR